MPRPRGAKTAGVVGFHPSRSATRLDQQAWMRAPTILKVSAGLQVMACKGSLFRKRRSGAAEFRPRADNSPARTKLLFVEADVVDIESRLQVMTSLPSAAAGRYRVAVPSSRCECASGFRSSCPAVSSGVICVGTVPMRLVTIAESQTRRSPSRAARRPRNYADRARRAATR